MRALRPAGTTEQCQAAGPLALSRGRPIPARLFHSTTVTLALPTQDAAHNSSTGYNHWNTRYVFGIQGRVRRVLTVWSKPCKGRSPSTRSCSKKWPQREGWSSSSCGRPRTSTGVMPWSFPVAVCIIQTPNTLKPDRVPLRIYYDSSIGSSSWSARAARPILKAKTRMGHMRWRNSSVIGG